MHLSQQAGSQQAGSSRPAVGLVVEAHTHAPCRPNRETNLRVAKGARQVAVRSAVLRHTGAWRGSRDGPRMASWRPMLQLQPPQVPGVCLYPAAGTVER